MCATSKKSKTQQLKERWEDGELDCGAITPEFIKGLSPRELGMLGELSLGHAGFMSVGAFAGTIASAWVLAAFQLENEVIRLIREEGAKPALIVGMPVGFVSAAESKDLLMTVNDIPWVAIKGRKGGSTLVVAAIHALLGLAEAEQKKAA